jgi:hypothetical protein
MAYYKCIKPTNGPNGCMVKVGAKLELDEKVVGDNHPAWRRVNDPKAASKGEKTSKGEK